MAEGKPTLQHLNNSQSQTILWLLEELGIEYNLNLFERETSGANKGRAPEGLKESHSLGKSPQLITPEGRVIIERSAISKYLIDKYDTTGKFKLNPDESENDIIREEELISFGANSLYPILMIQMVFKAARELSPFFVRPLMGGISAMVNKAFLTKEIHIMLAYLDEAIQSKNYFLNTENPTRVDFLMLWNVDFSTMADSNDLLSTYPNLKSWYDRCKARDAWKRSLEKGNGYQLDVKI
ncbi:hypothetical protein OHC33_001708 [Knufia fluminis]|uniref:Glutathione S-transferase n=1 Tax=Knufia fluminis TaxID=191047 RepID=A0AAN8IBM3_9EURO|nr:hypothetical protein OHC33_001708 [Knufia fluminis]